MAIDFSLAGPGFDPMQVLQAYGMAQDRGFQRQAQQRQVSDWQRADAQRQQQEAARPGIQAQIAAGDYGGAQAAAAGSGSFDYAKAIGDLSEEHRKQLDHEAEVGGQVGIALKSVPPDQRAALYSSLYAPQLKQAGFGDHEIAAFGENLSDAAIDGYIGHAMSVKDYVAAHRKATEPALRFSPNGGLVDFNDPNSIAAYQKWMSGQQPQVGGLPPGFVIDEDGGAAPSGQRDFQ